MHALVLTAHVCAAVFATPVSAPCGLSPTARAIASTADRGHKAVDPASLSLERADTEELLTKLKSPLWQTRERAAEILGNRGGTSAPVIDALKTAAGDEDSDVASAAGKALSQLGAFDGISIDDLLVMLRSPHWALRQAAAVALGKRGDASAPVIDALKTAAGDDDGDVASAAGKALSQLGAFDGISIDDLLVMLRSPHWALRQAAAVALGKRGEDSATVRQALEKGAGDDDTDVASAAVEALKQLGAFDQASTDSLLAKLQSPARAIRQEAAKAIAKRDHLSEPVVAALDTAADDDDIDVASSAVAALIQLGFFERAPIDSLLRRLGSSNLGIRQAAADALGKRGDRRKSVIEALTAAIEDDREGEVVATAAKAQASLGTSEETLVGLLATKLLSPDWQIRQAAAEALGDLGNTSEAAARALRAAADDDDSDVAEAAVAALVKLKILQMTPSDRLAIELRSARNWKMRAAIATTLGARSSDSPEVLTALEAAAEDEDSDVATAAVAALTDLGFFDQPSNILLDKLDSDSRHLRQAVATTLGARGDPSPEVFKALESAAGDEDPDVATAAVAALTNLGFFTDQPLDDLLAMLDSTSWRIRQAAATTLGARGSDSPEVRTALEAAAEDEDSDVATAAVAALTNLGFFTDEPLDDLLAMLDSTSWRIRQAAATTLGARGSDSPEVRTALEAAAEDEDSDVATAAVAALTDLGFFDQPSSTLLTKLDSDSRHLRRAVATTLGARGDPSPEVFKALEGATEDEDPDVATAAVAALTNLGFFTDQPLDDLLAMLGSTSWRIRQAAATTLRARGDPSPEVFKALEDAADDHDSDVASTAVAALGGLGFFDQAPIDELLGKLGSKNWQIRQAAAEALGRRSDTSRAVLDGLDRSTTDEDFDVAVAATSALRNLWDKSGYREEDLLRGLESKSPTVRDAAVDHLHDRPLTPQLLSQLSEVLNKKSEDAQLAAVRVLRSHPDDPEVAAHLEKLLHKSPAAELRLAIIEGLSDTQPRQESLSALRSALADRVPEIRIVAATKLRRHGKNARASIPALIKNLDHRDPEVFNAAFFALLRIIKDLHYTRDPTLLPDIAEAARQFRDLQPGTCQRHIERCRDLEDLKSDLGKTETFLRAQEPGVLVLGYNLIRTNGYAQLGVGLFLYVGVLTSVWIGLMFLRPLWILRIDRAVRRLPEFTLPESLGAVTLSIRGLLLLPVFATGKAVLDAWVCAHVQRARENFEIRHTVRERLIHIPIPVSVNRKTQPFLGHDILRETFGDGRKALLISGEGGVGKTSLACALARSAMSSLPKERFARHMMIPVLLEEELEVPTGGTEGSVLKEAIRAQLQAMTEASERIEDRLLDPLIATRRILVLIDHYSELTKNSQRLIWAGHRDFPSMAIVVTSRTDQEFRQVAALEVQPLRVERNRLSSFMDSYLTHRGEKDRFDDPEYFTACSRLSQLVGRRNATVLLAKLYAEQMIALKRENGGQLPTNVPELMLRYVNELNKTIGDKQFHDRDVQAAAKRLAWGCVRQTFRPGEANRADLLGDMEPDGGEALLDYLEDRLRLVRTVGEAQARLSFTLDPLAEYLAAMHLVETLAQGEEGWHGLLSRLRQTEGPIDGFETALRDCIAAESSVQVPSFVYRELHLERGAREQLHVAAPRES